MARADRDLAFMLRYENIAWYDSGEGRILDRRVYPAKTEFVTCRSHREVAQAVADMVTQSAGPYTAAGMGMALAAYECRDLPKARQLEYLEGASRVISRARPTTASRMAIITEGCLPPARAAIEAGEDAARAILEHTVAVNDARYRRMEKIGNYLVDMIPDGGAVMTQCFGETVVGMMCRAINQRGMRVRVFCPETRPYFQGARLTATVCAEMGMDVTVITDNMPATVMQREHIDVFTSAADAICLDGHVVNKVGTLQIAIVAKAMGVPYFVTGAPDPGHPTIDTVRIEQRDPEFVLQAMGVRTAAPGVKGYYPSFDITPPHLVSGCVTDRGIFSPYDLRRYFPDGKPELQVVV